MIHGHLKPCNSFKSAMYVDVRSDVNQMDSKVQLLPCWLLYMPCNYLQQLICCDLVFSVYYAPALMDRRSLITLVYIRVVVFFWYTSMSRLDKIMAELNLILHITLLCKSTVLYSLNCGKYFSK